MECSVTLMNFVTLPIILLYCDEFAEHSAVELASCYDFDALKIRILKTEHSNGIDRAIFIVFNITHQQ